MDNNDEGDEGLHTLDMRRRKISSRRSSILKLAGGKSPTRSALTDLDVNSRARRVSFSDTRTVKEFIKSDEGIVWTGLRDEVVPRAEQPSQESLSQLSASDKLHTESSVFESYKTEVMCSQSIQAPSAGSLAALLTKPIHRDADASSCVSDAQGFSPQKPVATDFIPTLLTQQQQSSDVSSGRREEIFDRYMDEMYVVREQVDYQTVLHTRVNKYAGSVSQSYGEDMKPEADSDADAEGTSEGRVSAKLFLQRLRSEKPFMQPPNDADNKTIHFHDNDPMEFTLCRENQTLVRPGAGIEIPNPSTSSVGNKTRIYDPNRTQQDEFDMELTTCLSEKHTETQGLNTAIKFGSTGDQTQPYTVVINPHLQPSSEDANRTQEAKVTAKSFIQRLRSGRPPMQLGSDDENKTIHFQDDDPMEITLCGGNRLLARPGIGTGMHDPSTSNAGNKTRIYDPNKTQQGEFDMDLTTCISEKPVEAQGLNNAIKFSSAADQNAYYPNINNPIEPCNQAARSTSEGKVNTKLFLQQLRSRKQPVPLQADGVHKSVDFDHPNNKLAQLDLSCSESLYLETDVLSAAAQPTGPILHVDTAMITSHLTRTHPKISDNNNRTLFHDNDFMELTVCRGNQSLVKPVASMEIPKPSAVSVGNRTRVYDPNKTQQGEFDMELTTCLPQQTSQSLQDGVNVVVGDPPGSSSENPAVFSPTNDDNKTVRFHDDDKLELTVCRGNQSLAKPEASIEIPKPSTVSVGNRTRLYDPNRTQQGEFDMELTTCLPQQTSESLQLETNIVAGNSLDGPTYSSNEEVSIKPGDNNVEGISGYNTNLNQQQLHLQDSMESPNKDDNKTIRFHGDELMELTACRGNQSLVIPGASIEIPKPSTGSVGNKTRMYDPNRTQQDEFDLELTTSLPQQTSQSLQDGVNVVVGDPNSSSENPAVFSPTNDDNKTIHFHDDDKLELTVCRGNQSLAKPEASIEISKPSTGSVGNKTRMYDPNETQQGEFDMELTTCLPQQTSQSLQDGVNVVVGNPPDSSLENPAVFSRTNDDNKTIHFHDDDKMELTVCRGNQSLAKPGASIEIPKPPTGSVGNRTRVYDPNRTQQGEFDMELTTCLPQQTSQSLQAGVNVVVGDPDSSSENPAVFSPTNDDNKTIRFHDDDKLELTVCRGNQSLAKPGASIEIPKPSTVSVGNRTRVYDPNRTQQGEFDMELTTCLPQQTSQSLQAGVNVVVGDPDSSSENPAVFSPTNDDNKTIRFHDDDKLELTVCRGNQSLAKPGASIEIPKPSTVSVGNRTRVYDPNRTQQGEFDMELTTCLPQQTSESLQAGVNVVVGDPNSSSENLAVFSPTNDDNKTIHFHDDDKMELTVCRGNQSLAKPGASIEIPKPPTGSVGNRTRVYDPNRTQQGEFDMELTTCLPQQTSESLQAGVNVVVGDPDSSSENPAVFSPTNDDNKTIHFHDDDKMELTVCRGNQSLAKPGASIEIPKPPTGSVGNRTRVYDPNRTQQGELDMELTTCLHQQISQSLQDGVNVVVGDPGSSSENPAVYSPTNDDNKTIRFHDDDKMELIVCIGDQSLAKPEASIEIPNPSTGSVGNRTRVYDPNKTQQGEFDMDLTTCLPQQTSQSLQDGVNVVVGNPPDSSSENPAVFSPTNDDNKTIRFHGDELMELTACRGNQSLVRPGASIEIPKPPTGSVGNRTRMYDPNKTQQDEFDMELTTCLPQQTSQSLQAGINVVADNSLGGPPYSSNEEANMKPGDNNVERVLEDNTNLILEQFHSRNQVFSPTNNDNKTIGFHDDDKMELTVCRGNQSLDKPEAGIEIPKPSTGSVGNRTRVYDPNRTQQGDFDMELTTCLPQQTLQSLQAATLLQQKRDESPSKTILLQPTNAGMDLTLCSGNIGSHCEVQDAEQIHAVLRASATTDVQEEKHGATPSIHETLRKHRELLRRSHILRGKINLTNSAAETNAGIEKPSEPCPPTVAGDVSMRGSTTRLEVSIANSRAQSAANNTMHDSEVVLRTQSSSLLTDSTLSATVPLPASTRRDRVISFTSWLGASTHSLLQNLRIPLSNLGDDTGMPMRNADGSAGAHMEGVSGDSGDKAGWGNDETRVMGDSAACFSMLHNEAMPERQTGIDLVEGISEEATSDAVFATASPTVQSLQRTTATSLGRTVAETVASLQGGVSTASQASKSEHLMATRNAFSGSSEEGIMDEPPLEESMLGCSFQQCLDQREESTRPRERATVATSVFGLAASLGPAMLKFGAKRNSACLQENQSGSHASTSTDIVASVDDSFVAPSPALDSVSPANVVSLSPIVSSGGEIPRYGRAGTASETPSRSVCDTEAPSNDCLGESDPFAKRPLVFYSPQMPSTTTRRESPVRAELSADSAHQVGQCGDDVTHPGAEVASEPVRDSATKRGKPPASEDRGDDPDVKKLRLDASLDASHPQLPVAALATRATAVESSVLCSVEDVQFEEVKTSTNKASQQEPGFSDKGEPHAVDFGTTEAEPLPSGVNVAEETPPSSTEEKNPGTSTKTTASPSTTFSLSSGDASIGCTEPTEATSQTDGVSDKGEPCTVDLGTTKACRNTTFSLASGDTSLRQAEPTQASSQTDGSSDKGEPCTVDFGNTEAEPKPSGVNVAAEAPPSSTEEKNPGTSAKTAACLNTTFSLSSGDASLGCTEPTEASSQSDGAIHVGDNASAASLGRETCANSIVDMQEHQTGLYLHMDDVQMDDSVFNADDQTEKPKEVLLDQMPAVGESLELPVQPHSIASVTDVSACPRVPMRAFDDSIYRELERELLALDESIQDEDAEDDLAYEFVAILEAQGSDAVHNEDRLWVLHDWREDGAEMHFISGSLALQLAFAPRPQSGDPHRRVTHIEMQSLLADDVDPLCHLVHKMVTESSRLESLSKLCQTTEDIPKVLEHISGVVAGAMSLDWEVESNILVTHLGGMQDNRLSVNFSSIQAYSKFTVTFHINPVVYPEERIFCECQHDIGDITTEKVLDALAQVPPGSNYLVNMVTIVDQMLYNHGTRRPS